MIMKTEKKKNAPFHRPDLGGHNDVSLMPILEIKAIKAIALCDD